MFSSRRGGLSPLFPAVPVPRSGALLGFFDPDPGVVFVGCFSADVFFSAFFFRSTVFHSMTAACPLVIAGVFGPPVSTLLAVFSGTISFPFFLSVLSERLSVNRASTVPSSSIICSIAIKRDWTLVSHAGGVTLSASSAFRYGGGAGGGVRPPCHLPYVGGEYVRRVPQRLYVCALRVAGCIGNHEQRFGLPKHFRPYVRRGGRSQILGQFRLDTSESIGLPLLRAWARTDSLSSVSCIKWLPVLDGKR
jgi:hypothetical protein